MRLKYLLPIVLTLVGVLVTATFVLAEMTTVDVTEPFTASGTATARLFRDGNPPSDCIGTKTYPGPFSSGSFAYSEEGPFGPVGSSGCVTVVWDPMTCDTAVHPVVFKDHFDPTWGPDNAANYLGDPGSSIATSFSFPVSAGDSFVLIILSNGGSAPSCSYHYSFSADIGAASTGPACQLAIPDGSVVGNTPYSAQVYYEPGNVSPGVFLNPGNYIVIGQDATETYYKIVLACQYVWVLKSDFQPSYEAPQNGAPLPTRVVDAPAAPSGDLPAAHD
ncbi:MAG: hypothetical protein U0521_09315 [Anaerolineae bacterium]